MWLLNHFQDCQLCPRNCRVNRVTEHHHNSGYCGETHRLRIAAIEAHFGEEPPISGTSGSGTVFFTGCSLKCIFCQNYQISHQKVGKYLSVSQVVDKIEELVIHHRIHNVNFVTPDHFLPYTVQIVLLLRRRKIKLPTVYNLSGFQRIESLRMIEHAADIYLPDFKYSDPVLAKRLSHCEDYPNTALAAITEMIKQKGFLNSCNDEADSAGVIATRGVLVRQLILPGQVKNSIDALTTLYLEFGKNLPLSLMSQYQPIKTFSLEFLNRRVTPEEFEAVYQHALQLGFEHLFVQFPEPAPVSSPFLPDFKQEHPFPGNVKSPPFRPSFSVSKLN